jgi:hypothetical protein
MPPDEHPHERAAFAKSLENPYLSRMFKAFEFCIPTTGTKVPAAPEWLHEIKYTATVSAWSATATACA